MSFSRLDQLLGRLYFGVGTTVGISIGLFAIAISLDLFLRLFGLGNLPGMQEIIEYFLFAGVFLAAPWVLRLGAHIRVDLVISSLPENVASKADRLLDLLGFCICCALVWFGCVNLADAYVFQSLQMKYFNVPEWWLLTVFVLSFFLLAFEFICRMIRGGNAPESLVDAEADGGGF